MSQVNAAIASPGQPLDEPVRARFEHAMGHDFSRVRIHTDSLAASSAAAINARAYTSGSHIVFAAGQYGPNSTAGAKLLAHELTHTLQSSNTGPSLASDIGATDSAEEREADAAADSVVGGEAMPTVAALPASAGGIVHRQPRFSEYDECGAFSSKELAPAKWRKCVDRKLLNAEEADPLRIAYSGVIATPEALIDWAFVKGFDQSTLMRKFGSRELMGSPKARDQARADLQWALADKSFEDRIAQKVAQRESQQEYDDMVAAAQALKQYEKAVEDIVKDYYQRGEKLKPRDGELLTIEEAAAKEAQGRANKKIYRFSIGWDQSPYWYGQTKNRWTVIVPEEGIIKALDRYYYRVPGKTMYAKIHGIDAIAEQVWESSKGINVAYGYLVKGVGHLSSLSRNPLFQMMGPMMTTAGEGMHYDVRKIDAAMAGDEFTEKAPEIGLHTLVEGGANVAGGRFGGWVGNVTSKWLPRGGKFVGIGAGLELSTVMVKAHDAATGKIGWDEVFNPNLSPVEFLVTMVEARLLQKFSDRWTKGRAPTVPKDVKVIPEPWPQSQLPTTKNDASNKAATAKGGAGTGPHKFPFKQVPEGVSAQLDAFRSRWNPKHNVELTNRGLEFCSPKPCPLLRKMYKRELKQVPQLATFLDTLEAKRIASPKDPGLRDQSLALEAKLAEMKAVNDFKAALPDNALAARARAVVESGNLDAEQIDAFGKAMRRTRSKEGKQRLLLKMEDMVVKSTNARGVDRMRGVDPEIDRIVDQSVNDYEAAAKTQTSKKTGSGSKSPPAKTMAPVDLPDIVQTAVQQLKAQGIKGLAPNLYGTKLHAEVNAILRSSHGGKVPAGWTVASEVKLSSIFTLSKKTAGMTVRAYLKFHDIAHRYPKFSRDLLSTKIGDLKPDVMVRSPDGRTLVWDLTSRRNPQHLAKTMFYAEVVGREQPGFFRVSEEYWAEKPE